MALSALERETVLAVLPSERFVDQSPKPVAFLHTDLGPTKTLSRPYTSINNPYSEAQFKTLKYRPDFSPTASEPLARFRPRTLPALSYCTILHAGGTCIFSTSPALNVVA
jgi:hypothetical protein